MPACAEPGCSSPALAGRIHCAEHTERLHYSGHTPGAGWHFTTTLGRRGDFYLDRASMVHAAHKLIKDRDPTNPWSPPEAQQRGEPAVNTPAPQPAYNAMTVKQLQQLGKERRLQGWHAMTKGQLVAGLIAQELGPVIGKVESLNPTGPAPEPDPWAIPSALRVDADEQRRRNEARKNEPVGTFGNFGAPTKSVAAQDAEKSKPDYKPAGGKREANGQRTITVMAQNNPKREGTAAHARFNLYKTGMTVEAFLAAGGTRADVNHDSSHGFIRLENGKH